MAEKTTHFYPEAMMIFVRGFQQRPNEEDTIVASNIGDPTKGGSVQEISSLNISLTVKNSPGTFSATIVDTNNKFIEPDFPEEEVPTHYSSNKRPVKYFSKRNVGVSGSVVKNEQGVVKQGSGLYEFPTYDDWLDFEFGNLEDPNTGKRFPIYYRRNETGNIVERWAFDDKGNIISVVPNGSNLEESYNRLEDGYQLSFPVYTSSGTDTEPRLFIFHKAKNSDFINLYKDVEEQGLKTFNRGRCKISPMDRVVIYLPERFGNERTLARAFTGLVNTVQQSYSENQTIITINGEDVTKYLRLSVIPINPALPIALKGLIPDQSTDTNITAWGDVFQGLSAPDILRVVLLGSGAISSDGIAKKNKITGVGAYKSQEEGDKDYKYKVETDEWIEEDAPTDDPNRTKGVTLLDFSEILGALFQDSSVHIINPFQSGSPLEGFRPYELSLSTNWSLYQGDFKTRRDLAYSLATDTHFAFYADRKGHIWFHPPRFNNGHILGAKNPQVYVIDTESILSYGFIEDDTNIYSSVYVSTTPKFGNETSQNFGAYNAAHRDEATLLKYGQRLFTYFNPLIQSPFGFNSGKDKQSLILHAKSLLQRMLASKYQGQVTLTGRVELDPGYPVYIPIRNMVYYVETVDHSISYGGKFETTLNLAYGRKPWDHLPELLTFSSADEVYMVDAPTKQRMQPKPKSEDQVKAEAVEDSSWASGLVSIFAGKEKSATERYKKLAGKYSIPYNL